jgi:hypothetical protein
MLLGAFRGGNPLERIVAISDKWSGKLPRYHLGRDHIGSCALIDNFWASSPRRGLRDNLREADSPIGCCSGLLMVWRFIAS